jgi:hypothetical protein
MLNAVSALTVIGLSLGAPPLAAASALVEAIGRLDRTLGVELRLLDRTTDALLKALEPATSHEVRSYLDAIRRDQGAVIQLTPEAMDLFQAGIEDRPGVHYACACAQAPPPSPAKLARSFAGPWRAISSAIFTTLYGITARYDERYPCASPEIPEEAEAVLARAFGKAPGARANDGVVPVLSQVWGRVAWAGYADHLDVLGHFPGAVTPRPFWSSFFGGVRAGAGTRPATVRAAPGARVHVGVPDAPTLEESLDRAAEAGGVVPDPVADALHVDWLRSGAGFDERSFGVLMDALANGMLAAC